MRVTKSVSRAGEDGVDVDPLQRRRQQTDSRKFRGAAADPVPHRKPLHPLLIDRDFVEFGTIAGNGDRVFAEVEIRALISGGGGEHSVARFLGPARFGDDHGKRTREIVNL